MWFPVAEADPQRAGDPRRYPRREFTRDSIQQKVRDTGGAQWPVHAVITNSTYDGLLYNTTA